MSEATANLPNGVRVVLHSDKMYFCVQESVVGGYWNSERRGWWASGIATKYISAQSAAECFLADQVHQAILEAP